MMTPLTHRQLQIIGLLGRHGLRPGRIMGELGINRHRYGKDLRQARARTGTKTIEQLIWHVATQVARVGGAMSTKLSQLQKRHSALPDGVTWLASLGHTQHHTHPQASRLGWRRCSLTECETARKILRHDAALRAEQEAKSSP